MYAVPDGGRISIKETVVHTSPGPELATPELVETDYVVSDPEEADN